VSLTIGGITEASRGGPPANLLHQIAFLRYGRDHREVEEKSPRPHVHERGVTVVLLNVPSPISKRCESLINRTWVPTCNNGTTVA
jgi:hypothetical protein